MKLNSNASVKCDEGQPQCSKCLSYGVVCNYKLPHNSDLQPRWQAAQSKTQESKFEQIIFNAKPQRTIIPPVRVGSDHNSFIMDPDSLARLDRFQKRTVFTFGSKWAFTVYQNDVVKLAIQVRILDFYSESLI